jgi:hypothetical protein
MSKATLDFNNSEVIRICVAILDQHGMEQVRDDYKTANPTFDADDILCRMGLLSETIQRALTQAGFGNFDVGMNTKGEVRITMDAPDAVRFVEAFYGGEDYE